MLWSISNGLTKSALKYAAAALMAVSALATSAPASAELAPGAKSLDWYIFVGRNAKKNPIVVYFQSDSSKKEFTPVGSVAMILNPSYKLEKGKKFDPTKACAATSLDFDAKDAKKLRVKLIYGPNSKQKPVSVIDFPSYMAQQTALTLIQEGVLIDEKAAAPYFSCAGWVWSQLISQKKETWEKIITEELKKKGKKPPTPKKK
ncbi:MAG: hypothetical protein MRY74_01585 [Neomegalonema sp.]|nr:hypothetical protein [Neomegalonema sp.]